MNKEVIINYRILDIDTVSFFEHRDDDITDDEDVKLDVAITLLINSESETIGFLTIVKYFVTKNKRRKNIFGIETVFDFEIQNLSKRLDKAINKINLPDSFMEELISISVSGTRGILIEKLSNPSYKEYILPIVDSKLILKDIKKKLK